MTVFDEMTRAVTCKYNDQIRRGCSTLFELLGLNNFWYYKLTESGGYSYLGSDAPYSEYYSAKKFYLNFPFYRHPRFFKTGITLFSAESGFSAEFLSTDLKFNFNNPILFLTKTFEGVEAFGFSSISAGQAQLVKVLNELDLLRLFVRNFKDSNRALFYKLEDNQIDLASLVGSFFYQGGTADGLEDASRDTFLRKMGVHLGAALTSREIDIAKLVLLGLSAGEIGSKFFLSRRTVEHHIERIKEKLSCASKSELIQKARELERFKWIN
jgi:DNA-binding CsgD family transcriptional regulator